MRMCKDHWAELRKAIEDKGMAHLVSKSGEEAMERIKEELETQAPIHPSKYDPLMSCNFMICERALQCAGLWLMTPKDNGEPRCPLCELNNAREEAIRSKAPEDQWPEHSTDWIKGSTDGAFQYCKENNLLPKVN